MKPFFENTREATWRVLALAVVLASGMGPLLNFAVRRPAVREVVDAVERATGGLVQTPLLVGPFYLAVVGAAIFGVGRIRCADVGWRRSAVTPGFLATVEVVWFALVLVLLLVWPLAGKLGTRS